MTAGQVAMLLVLAVIAISLGVAANREWKRADRAEREADDHAANAAEYLDGMNKWCLANLENATKRLEAEQEVADLTNALVVEQADHERTRQAWHDAMAADNVLPMYQPATDARLVALDGGKW